MKVKKYTAASMPEAMNQIRKELGADAVILNSREVQQGGFLGFFKKKNIEVVAALDPKPVHSKKANIQVESSSHNNRKDTHKVSHDVLHEIKDLKKMLEVQAKQNKEDFPPLYQVAFQHLLDQEVDTQLATDLIESIKDKNEHSQDDSSMDSIMNDLRAEITDRLHKIRSYGITYDKKIVQFVGPTGVGKTTTIAKVAAKIMLEEKKSIALITADTYRIGAVDQLKTYARILNVPLEVVYTLDDYQNAVNKFDSYDVILVDTAGRNFRDMKYVDELKEMLDMKMVHTYLVLSLTAKPKDIIEIYDQFDHLPIDRVIFTKLDETRQFGSILNVVLGKNIGIACMTNGQDVPEDLLGVEPENITNLLAGEISET